MNNFKTKIALPVSILLAGTWGTIKISQLIKTRSMFTKAESSFAKAFDTDFTAENVKDAVSLAAVYKVVMKAHPDDAYGNQAKEKLDKMVTRATKRREQLLKEFDETSKPVTEALANFEVVVGAFAVKVRDYVNHSFSDDHVKVGNCIASNSSSEFDKKEMRYVNLKIVKVLGVGKREAQYEEIFSPGESDLHAPDDALEKQNAIKSEYINLMGDYKMECQQADRIVQSYKELLTVAKPLQPLRQQIQYLNSILSPEIL